MEFFKATIFIGLGFALGQFIRLKRDAETEVWSVKISDPAQ